MLAVALGGAIGAVSRLSVTQLLAIWLGKDFPWGTLMVNLLGCLIIGYLVGLWSQIGQAPSINIRAGVIVGFLGAFTTMSTFSLDSLDFIQRGEWIKASSYIGITFIGSLMAVGIGVYLASKS